MKLADENWQYYLGDTFQFWTGATPPISHPKYIEVMGRLKKSFHRYNVVRKIVNHYCNALVGKPFNWYLKSEGEKDLSQLETYLQLWLDFIQKNSTVQQLGNPLQNALTQMLVRDNGNGIGTGYLRLYSPIRYQNLDFWKSIVLHCPDPGSITIKRDDDGILYWAEYTHINGKEIYELLDNGLTKITTNKKITEINLGGRLPIFEFHGKCLINEDIKDAQNAINKGLTLKGENLNFAGFLERVILNGQMPGSWIKDPSSPNGEKFVPNASGVSGGPGNIIYVQGIPLGDRKNPAGYTNPEITYRDPVDIDNFIKDFDLNLKCAYLAADLGHLLSVADGSLSGVSRKTIKEDFITGLGLYALNIEIVLSEILDTVLLLFASKINLNLAGASSVVKLDLNLGAPLPEERQQNREDYNAGLLSWTTAVLGTGEVSDPDAEWELKQRENAENNPIPEQSFVEQFADETN